MVALFFIGRIIFGGYFIYNAYNHFKNAGHLAGYAGMKGVPAPKAGVITSGVLFLLGGLSIGYRGNERIPIRPRRSRLHAPAGSYAGFLERASRTRGVRRSGLFPSPESVSVGTG